MFDEVIEVIPATSGEPYTVKIEIQRSNQDHANPQPVDLLRENPDNTTKEPTTEPSKPPKDRN